ncbi:hypothetical protein MPF19_05240 [Polaribacter sp. Z014]|uniref:hypothetical protein n=1 Tax=unclassified Polaribacter TaxID=196858 RepID=UPI00193C0543|nr:MULTISPECIES: hypothetical protein [unclassified Polaribacter]MCL7762812.1 hypothetical protein [Polaribacter sp. Z014]QVY66303.1 hypothetical protein JOP69_03125 [Polaribacter sp. Q13]
MKHLSFILFFCTLNSFSQVGINTTTLDPSAILDVTSIDKGVLVPRINLTSTLDITTITSPLTSLLIFNTATVADVTQVTIIGMEQNGQNYQRQKQLIMLGAF